MNGLPWWTLASCQHIDPELWFPAHGQSGRMARRVCGRCPVQAECLRDALETEAGDPVQYKWGIRAGLDPRQRDALATGMSPYHGTTRGWREHIEAGQTPCTRCETAELASRQRKAPVPSQRKGAPSDVH